MRFKIIGFILLFYYLYSSTTYAKVVINEFVIDNSPQQVELLNTSSDRADISGWFIDDSGGNSYFTIPNTILYPNSCVVFSSDFNFNKSTPDIVRLFDATALPTSSSAHLIDSFAYKSSSGSAISFSRIPDGENNWASAEGTFGKYNPTKQSCIVTPSPTPFIPSSIILSAYPSQTPSPIMLQSIDHIYISEAMVYPLSGEHEWVELYNDNDFSVTLHNWYIDDTANSGSSPKLFSITIPAKGHGVIDLSSSLFNNDFDSIRLLDFSKLEKDSLEYIAPQKGKTVGIIDIIIHELCNQEPSKGTTNTGCIAHSETFSQSTSKMQFISSITPTIVSKPNSSKMPIASTIRNQFPINTNTGQVLSENDEISIKPTIIKEPIITDNNQSKFNAYVKGFSSSTIIISLSNIFFILMKIIKSQSQHGQDILPVL